MKVGLIRCMQTEDMCPGTRDFKIMKEKKCAFLGIEEDIEIHFPVPRNLIKNICFVFPFTNS